MDDTKRDAIRKTAAHMRLTYRGHKYSAQERAWDHAFSHDRTHWRHGFWLAVAGEITQQETEEREAG
jgi:hypothetical protein